MLIVLLFTILATSWFTSQADKHYYLEMDTGGSAGVVFINSLLTYEVAYSHIIPISLYVGLELLKLLQAFYINHDDQMGDKRNRAMCRNSDLVEELGQVSYVFSDKTGTLTKNEMVFRCCTVLNERFGNMRMVDGKPEWDDYKRDIEKFANDPENVEEGRAGEQKATVRDEIEKFFTLIAICHSAGVESSKGKPPVYSSSSPDEVALLAGAAGTGIKFLFKDRDVRGVAFPDGRTQFWELIEEIPFDSTRKRMSVIVRFQESMPHRAKEMAPFKT